TVESVQTLSATRAIWSSVQARILCLRPTDEPTEELSGWKRGYIFERRLYGSKDLSESHLGDFGAWSLASFRCGGTSPEGEDLQDSDLSAAGPQSALQSKQHGGDGRDRHRHHGHR